MWNIKLAGSQVHTLSSCPSKVYWNDDGLERDLYIKTTTVTVLAMDGRRRWLDIQNLVSFATVYILQMNPIYLFLISFLSGVSYITDC